MEIQRYSGAGNTFVMVNNLDGKILNRREAVLELISRDENKNFDGVIFLEDSSIADFHMNYFNRDGTGDALCGNGLRCTARYILDNCISDKNILLIEAVEKIYNTDFHQNGEISVGFPPPAKLKLKFKLKVHFTQWWQLLTVSYTEVGSPHIVVFIDNIEKPAVKSLDDIPIDDWGRNLRMHKDLMPEGANVNFVKVESPERGEIAIRSFERGVEAETLACGTGALSSAIVSYALRDVKTPVRVMTKSGEYLTVNFDIIENQIRNLSLAGNAVRLE